MHARARPARARLFPHGTCLAEASGMQLNDQSGKVGWLVLWLIGVPIPVLIVLYLLRGCT